MNKYILILVFILFALVIHAHAEYYKYVDENENVVFTDNINNIPENQRSKVKILREQQGTPESSREKDLPNQYKSEEDTQRQFMDTLKKNYGAKESCPEETKGEAEQAIKTTWTKMAQAMVSGNLEKAFSYFSIFTRDEMRRKMSNMSREKIKNIFSNYKSIEIESFYQDDGIAECRIIREEKDGAYSYPASFVKDIDCEWRLRGL